MFERFPQPGFVADPGEGSNHNRGAAVDVTLVDGERNEIPMRRNVVAASLVDWSMRMTSTSFFDTSSSIHEPRSGIMRAE